MVSVERGLVKEVHLSIVVTDPVSLTHLLT